MAKYYDNLDDVKSKLVGTIVYYDGTPVIVKSAEVDEGELAVQITNHLSARGTSIKKITDPLLNYMKFNLGYANYSHGAVWWYRVPHRQYRQGLKHEQMRYSISERALNPGHTFQAGNSVNEMLLNKYPSIETIEEKIRDSATPVMAFHKNFAMSWDRVHKDMIVEYKGQIIGCMSGHHEFKLMDEYNHLQESLMEVVGVH